MNNATRDYMRKYGLELIADFLSEPGRGWSPNTLGQVVDILESAGHYVAGNAADGEIYLRRTSCLCIRDLPEQCITDCSASGDVTGVVEHWQRSLPFNVEPEAAREYLARTGGWDRDELEGEDPDTLAQRVLWIACGDFSECINSDGECGTDVFSIGDV
jgi:hypothetical protein